MLTMDANSCETIWGKTMRYKAMFLIFRNGRELITQNEAVCRVQCEKQTSPSVSFGLLPGEPVLQSGTE